MSTSIEIRELLRRLGERMAFEQAASWDPVGLQIGDPDVSVARVAVCHEVTEAVVEAAIEARVELLVTYHPLLFRPLRSLRAGPGAEGRAFRLARAGVALVVVHTAFDVCNGGAADALAEVLGLEQVRGFAPLFGAETIKVVTFAPAEAVDGLLDAVSAAGAGRIGQYTHCAYRNEGFGSFFAGTGTQPEVGQAGKSNLEAELRVEFPAPRALESEVLSALIAAHPYEEPVYDVYDRRGNARLLARVGQLPAPLTLDELSVRVRSALGDCVLRTAGEATCQVQRVALSPGSGGSFVDAAASQGAEVLITGDVRHHEARNAIDRGLALIDPGHAPTERPGLQRLAQWLDDWAPEVLNLLDRDPDPWR